MASLKPPPPPLQPLDAALASSLASLETATGLGCDAVLSPYARVPPRFLAVVLSPVSVAVYVFSAVLLYYGVPSTVLGSVGDAASSPSANKDPPRASVPVTLPLALAAAACFAFVLLIISLKQLWIPNPKDDLLLVSHFSAGNYLPRFAPAALFWTLECMALLYLLHALTPTYFIAARALLAPPCVLLLSRRFSTLNVVMPLPLLLSLAAAAAASCIIAFAFPDSHPISINWLALFLGAPFWVLFHGLGVLWLEKYSVVSDTDAWVLCLQIAPLALAFSLVAWLLTGLPMPLFANDLPESQKGVFNGLVLVLMALVRVGIPYAMQILSIGFLLRQMSALVVTHGASARDAVYLVLLVFSAGTVRFWFVIMALPFAVFAVKVFPANREEAGGVDSFDDGVLGDPERTIIGAGGGVHGPSRSDFAGELDDLAPSDNVAYSEQMLHPGYAGGAHSYSFVPTNNANLDPTD